MGGKLKWVRSKAYTSIKAMGVKREFYIAGFKNKGYFLFNLIVDGKVRDIPYGNLSSAVGAANSINNTDAIISGTSLDAILEVFIGNQNKEDNHG